MVLDKLQVVKEFYISYELRTHLQHFGCYISDIVAISASPFRRDYAITELIFEDRSEIWQQANAKKSYHINIIVNNDFVKSVEKTEELCS